MASFPKVTSMDDLFGTSELPTLPDTTSVIGSLVSAVGRSRSKSQDGQKAVQSGPHPVPVSRFRALDSEKSIPTNDTSGPLFTHSSPSAALQRALANRLATKLPANGSPEFDLTWKQWDMPAGVPICALRASKPRTSGSGFIGLPTPTCPVNTNGHQAGNNRFVTGTVMPLQAWRTPDAYHHGGAQDQEKRRAGGHAITLQDQVTTLLSWAAPRARDHKNNGVSIARAAKGIADSLDLQSKMVSLNGTDGPSPLDARMERGGFPLNPMHSLWLMGYSAAWENCMERAMRSFRKSPRSSSKPSSKPSAKVGLFT